VYNKTNQMHQFPKFTLAWNSTCFGQFLCSSSGVYSPYTRHWYMSYRFEDSFRAGQGWSCSKDVYKPVRHMPVSSVQWINSWWWAEELSETCRVSCLSKFGKLVHMVGFIIKKFVTMHGHVNVKLQLYLTTTATNIVIHSYCTRRHNWARAMKKWRDEKYVHYCCRSERPFERRRKLWTANIQTTVKEKGCADLDWINVTEVLGIQ
jgi:hypothetical protein